MFEGLVVEICGFVFFIILAYFVGRYAQRRDLKRDIMSLEDYRKNNLQMQGVDVTYGKYDLRSLNGGKNWFAVDEDSENGEVGLVGDAEEVFPGLLEHLRIMDITTVYLLGKGPIVHIGPEEAEILKEFTKSG